MSGETDYGVHKVVQNLRGTLQAYLEAQYHIKHPSLIEERRRLLEAPGTIHQLPYVEATPSYAIGASYGDLKIPTSARDLLENLAALRPDVGIFPKPYSHQSRALEAFLGAGDDLIVATGTGSGKTESFLMPILGSLAVEGKDRPASASRPGCRALLLYPMNALVNDQLGRIRKLFGDPRVAEKLKTGRGRFVRFGSYTGRTPYPGERTGSKDARYFQPMFEDFYLRYLGDAAKVQQLSERGKWPCKDLEGFYGADRVEKGVYRSGKKRGQAYTRHNWGDRLFTQEGDRELLARHEIQAACPDILITNYSMLEYMLLRPIERSIFAQTRAWLDSNPANEIIVVLDEAHMYRGAGGAEVALLLRRFQARLGIPRERVRYILTSASLGEGPAAEAAVVQFAKDLTGLQSTSSRRMSLVKGERESRRGARPGNGAEAAALAGLPLAALHRYFIDPKKAIEAIGGLAASLSWPAPPESIDDVPDYLFRVLEGFGPLEEAIRLVSGKALELSELGGKLFPSATDEDRRKCSEALLTLGTLARRKSDKRVLLPTRLHLFYRGLPALYACTNRKCDARLDVGRAEIEYVLGRLHTEPRTHCTCSGQSRVYELLTHRDCGTAFLRAFVRGPRGEFLWHEPSGDIGSEECEALHEIHLLVEGEPHPDARTDAAEGWVDTATGRTVRGKPASEDGYLRIFFPTKSPEPVRGRLVLSFERCPVCLRGRSAENSKIMDLATKGEAPFANLVKAQVVNQPPRMPEGPGSPNGGRKSLLFSDGRQKAARLARDIPREVELDSFRQAIALAAKKLVEKGYEAKLTQELYIGFVAVASDFSLHFFDGGDQRILLEHQAHFQKYYGADLDAALDDKWDVEPPGRYREALLRQLCSPFYSLHASTIGYVKPVRMAFRLLHTEMTKVVAWSEAEVLALACAWISDLLNEYAFDRKLKRTLREVAAGYRRGVWGSQGKLKKPLGATLVDHLGVPATTLPRIAEVLQTALCETERDMFYLDPNRVCLVADLECVWYQCGTCTFLSSVVIGGRCAHCGSSVVHALDPLKSEYIRARKGFWRNPVIDSLSGRARPRHITAEEHTAQLSQRDAGVVHATTEKYELRFQDVVIGQDEGPIDVLSCTTTMEVGVDIGSLIAVGLRNVPPQRENYQQRAGRSGRRGSAVSTVVTYGQGGHHDSFYFHNPVAMVAGPPRKPVVKIDNPKICRRHVHAFLFQTFFHDAIDRGVPGIAVQAAAIQKALGRTEDFFEGPHGSQVNLEAFTEWVRRNLSPGTPLLGGIVSWIPEAIAGDRPAWVRAVGDGLIARLGELKTLWAANRSAASASGGAAAASGGEEGDDDEEGEGDGDEPESSELLTFLFDQGVLPTYAFPTDLCSFLVEELSRKRGRTEVMAKERPQQAIAKALSEYAPGRLIVIDKRTYRSGGVAASTLPSEVDRAVPLFARGMKPYIYCRACAFVQDPDISGEVPEHCPLCHGEIGKAEMLQPQVFHPENASEIDETDREQEFTYATAAQFPVPAGEGDLGRWKDLGRKGRYTHSSDRKLVIVNRGRKGEDNGFEICERCGIAKPEGMGDPIPGRHQRPYLVQTPTGAQPSPCDGRVRNAFLGHTFRSDLFLIRIALHSPLATDMRSSVVRGVLDDSLRSISEALLLAASRLLDIDPSEFSAGYRIVPGATPDQKGADVYLFDTLAGGAGYSDQAGQAVDDVLRETIAMLEGCPGNCDRSCYQCLRHYANQYWHERLDRHLALALLRWMQTGANPATDDLLEQRRRLQPLKRMLELEGYACDVGATVNGCPVPLIAKKGARTVAVGSYPGHVDLVARDFNHPLLEKVKGKGPSAVELLNEYLLSRNLPAAYGQVRRVLEGATGE